MSQIQKLDYSAADLQKIFQMEDGRRAMATYFVAGAVHSMESLKKIIHAAADLIPNTAAELRDHPPQTATIGTATALALRAATELTGGKVDYVFADTNKAVLLGAVVSGQGDDKRALIYDAQKRGFDVAAPADWEQRAQQSLNAVPGNVPNTGQEMRHAL